eukprot:CAMPEP_0185910266 /NCGR_PEP_ID=MMETSP0196C-20130402/18358_1 /TAXON_ID=2932 /ORGANISM="Alexandrium fundyense, Strain CCMP1719" /LENGTH=61 /DNA_ID=CAMNT_0028630975 /DNA_START=1 /DNA_END=182 /DNA_ORIENTATION=-
MAEKTEDVDTIGNDKAEIQDSVSPETLQQNKFSRVIKKYMVKKRLEMTTETVEKTDVYEKA